MIAWRAPAGCGTARGELVGEPLPGQPLDQFRHSGAAMRAQVAAASIDEDRDVDAAGVVTDTSVRPHRELDQRVSHHSLDSTGWTCRLDRSGVIE